MLLNKKIKFILAPLIITIILPLAYSQQTCTAAEIKDALRKALFEYFEAPASSKLAVNEIKDFLHFYISIDSNQLTTDCSGSGPLSGKPYYLMLGVARNIDRGIPKCGDGTEYGKCSSNVPNYCYGGRLEERCRLCGCPSGKACSSTGTCVGETAKPVESQICEKDVRITTNSADQRNPAIYGDKIVWTDYRNGVDKPYIYMYDLAAGKETQIAQGVGPAIYKDKIVWTDYRDTKNYTGYNFYGRGDIYMYDITTGKETPISTVIGSQLAPHIYENKIVWYDYRDSNSDTDIYMYDLITGKETKIGGITGLDNNPRIYGDRVVWFVYNSNTRDWDVYMYEISTGRQTQITKGQDSEVWPYIYGDKIVWVTQYESRTNEFPVYLYDINTKTQTRITSHSSTNFFPKIDGNRIAWMDYRSYSNSNPDIYMYDLATGKETQITTNVLSQGTPAIHDNKIVWEDNRNGNYDIYMATLSDAAGKCVSSQIPTEPITEPIPPVQALPNPPQITSINPSTGSPNTQITLTGTGFTPTGNSINWGDHLNAIRDLPSSDGKTLAFPALSMQCPQKTCPVSVTNANGTSNPVAFNLTHRPAKKPHKGPPHVKILTPNGGERFVKGKDKINISWSGGLDSVMLVLEVRNTQPYYIPEKSSKYEFYYSSGPQMIIAKDLPPSGSYEWDGKMLCGWAYNTNTLAYDEYQCPIASSWPQYILGFYKIEAISQDKKGEKIDYTTLYDGEHDNWDESDDPFLIVNQATISSLEVVSPNGEERWMPGEIPYWWTDADYFLYPWSWSGTFAPFAWNVNGFSSYNSLTWELQPVSINILKGGKFFMTLYSGAMYHGANWDQHINDLHIPPLPAGDDYTTEIIFHGPNGDVKGYSSKPFSIGIIPGVVGIKASVYDKFTNSRWQIPNGFSMLGYTPIMYPGTRKDGTPFFRLFPDWWNKEFNFGMNTDDASLATQKARIEWDFHVPGTTISVAKKSDGNIEALLDIIDGKSEPLHIPVVDSKTSLQSPMWTSAGLYISSDIDARYRVEYAPDGKTFSGSLAAASPPSQYYWWPTTAWTRNHAPLKYDGIRVVLTDSAGKEYAAPPLQPLGFEYSYLGYALLRFEKGNFKWQFPSTIAVVSPNGGEWWKVGTTQTIRWNVNNPSDSLYRFGGNKVYIFHTNGYYDVWGWWDLSYSYGQLIGSADLSAGSFNWTIPTSTPLGGGRIRVVVSRGDPQYYGWDWLDYSDGKFGIAS